MKKLLFAICAVAALASCSKEEVVSYDKGEAISFANPFVNKATRADYSDYSGALKAFKVYGTVKPDAAGTTTQQIYNGANVKLSSGALDVAWDCDVTNYWQPSSTYNFAAIADGEATTTTLPETINFTVADGTDNKDLLYATATVTTNGAAVPTGVNSNNCVAFDFTHLLSKMQFTIVNETNQTYQVTGISVTGFTNTGDYAVAGGTWAKATGAADNVTLTFGTTGNVTSAAPVVASETRQFLPVNQTLGVTITYNVMQGANVVGTLTKTGTIAVQDYVKNTVYNVVATLSGNEIKFTVQSVGGWSTPTPPNIEL